MHNIIELLCALLLLELLLSSLEALNLVVLDLVDSVFLLVLVSFIGHLLLKFLASRFLFLSIVSPIEIRFRSILHISLLLRFLTLVSFSLIFLGPVRGVSVRKVATILLPVSSGIGIYLFFSIGHSLTGVFSSALGSITENFRFFSVGLGSNLDVTEIGDPVLEAEQARWLVQVEFFDGQVGLVVVEVGNMQDCREIIHEFVQIIWDSLQVRV